jgi:hypothetical protein
VSNETNLLEQIATARRIGELWLRHAEQYLKKYRSDYEVRVQSRYDAIEAKGILEDFGNAGRACFGDLTVLLKSASQLPSSELRKLEPKWSRAKPILSRAGAVLDQVEGVGKEISCEIATRTAEDKTARPRRNVLGAVEFSITCGGLYAWLLLTPFSLFFLAVWGANLLPLALFVLPGLLRWLAGANDESLFYNVGKETEIRAIRMFKSGVSRRRVDPRNGMKAYYRAKQQLLKDPFSENKKGQNPRKNGKTLNEIAKRSRRGAFRLTRVARRIPFR